ncbi:MAG TPA: response regulator transcription factor [Bdellovibrionota bacterium]|jgi:two-component system phosphate regulon response regulator PhoB|nr:response regulator transcription factor [Bdellovibrionota bacterium]
MQRLLLVEDSRDTIKIVESLFSSKYVLRVAMSIAEARRHLAEERFDLLLVDLMLPDGSGFELVSEVLGGDTEGVPSVFLLTGRSEDHDKLHAFQLGAEDYITKPFSPTELRARVDGRMRRLLGGQGGGLKRGQLRLDTATHRVIVASEQGGESSVDVTMLEFKLLHYFMRHEDQVLSRQQIMTAVWGANVHVLDRTIDSQVSRLRKKISAADHNIHTVTGAGYAFRKVGVGAKSRNAA